MFQWSSILPAIFEHKIYTRPDIFLKNMSNFFLLVSNYMLHGLGLLGRIEPARKARSPLGVSGNQGFYRHSHRGNATVQIRKLQRPYFLYVDATCKNRHPHKEPYARNKFRICERQFYVKKYCTTTRYTITLTCRM